jgi:membrane-associated phospholipid phosphatase
MDKGLKHKMILGRTKMGHYSRTAILIIISLLIVTSESVYSLSGYGNDHFAIRHDLNGFDICHDLKHFAIPHDLNRFDIRHDLKHFDIRHDLNRLVIISKDADTVSGSSNYTKTAPPNTRLLIPGIASLALITFLIDEPVVSFSRTNQTNFLKTVAHYTDAGGEKKIVVPGILLTYVTARFLIKDERLKNTTLNSIQSVIVTAVATEGIKYLAGRARPFTGEGAYSFQPFPIGVDRYKSLPSGHASLAFALFTPFAETYSRWIYVVPVSVALGRVYQDKHWLSDVVTGSGLGLISGILFTHHENFQIIPNGLRIYF